MNNVHELLPFYALDMLTREERMAVEDYLKNNPSARMELAELHEATERLIQTIEPLTPSPQTKANLMARVAKSTQSASTVVPVRKKAVVQSWWQKPLFQRAVPAVGMALAVVAFVWAFTLLDSLNNTRAELTALEATRTALRMEVDDLRLQNQTLSQELEREAELMQTLTSLDSEQVSFGSADSTHGILTINRSAETAFLTVAGLDSLTAAQTYQLWFIGESGANSGGTFTVDEAGHGNLLVESDAVQSFATLGISVEPSSGSETPTEVVFSEDL